MTEIVTADSFARAESNRMFAAIGHDTDGINSWKHYREPSPLDHQNVIRLNRDTLYSASIVDAREGFTLTLPETDGRYMSAMIIDQDHYIPVVFHGAGEHHLTREQAGTDYVLVGIRTLVDPGNADDVAAVNALQDQLSIVAGSAIPFELPSVDDTSLSETRDALLTLAKGLPDYSGAFGAREDVDAVHHLIGSASAWGGLPETEAFYVNVEPGLPVGDYELTVTDVPVHAFWSVSVYNKDGFFEPDDRGVNNLNSITSVRNDDGSTTIRFGAGDAPNTIPITDGWNYLVRLYQPRPEVLDGTWTFPSVSASVETSAVETSSVETSSVETSSIESSSVESSSIEASAPGHIAASGHIPAPGEPSIPEIEEDETIAPRPEEEIADRLRAKPDVDDHSHDDAPTVQP